MVKKFIAERNTELHKRVGLRPNPRRGKDEHLSNNVNTVSDIELSSLNPDLYRGSIDTEELATRTALRYEVRHHEARDCLEVNIVKVKNLPEDVRELHLK